MNQTKLNSLALLVGRIGLGLVILYYGSQKALGVFGGSGIQGTIEFMQKQFHISQPFAILNIVSEFLGSIAVIIGLLTRLAAFGILCSMAVATYLARTQPGFMASLQKGDVAVVNLAFYPFINAVGALAIVIAGAGDYSLDRKFFGKKRAK